MLTYFLLACGSIPTEKSISDSASPDNTGCNGFSGLCDQTLDMVAFTGTHNAMSNAEDGWLAPNQGWNITHQLEAGVRALNLDTYDIDDTVMLCHGYCELGQRPLIDALLDLRSFIDAQPNSVIIITFQDAADASQTLDVFEEAGIKEWMHNQAIDAPWPTLQELIDAGTPLVVFAAQYGGNETPGYHAQWDYWIDTPYQAQSTADFSCEADRGNIETASLLNVNHFITNPIALPEHAEVANTAQAVQTHLDKCIEERQHPINQILIDFVDIGETLSVIDSINLTTYEN